MDLARRARSRSRNVPCTFSIPFLCDNRLSLAVREAVLGSYISRTDKVLSTNCWKINSRDVLTFLPIVRGEDDEQLESAYGDVSCSSNVKTA
jgi:hypothetical protein